MVGLSFKEAYEKGLERLLESGIENARFDCGVLFEEAFDVDFLSFRFSDGFLKTADEKSCEDFFEMTEKRCNGVPLQYIVGRWEFFGLPFYVGEGVLVPRQDTETLVEFAISKFKDKKNIRLCDLCAGSGCIGITLEKHLDCKTALCVELSDKAFGFLEKNIELNKSGVKAVLGDVTDEGFVKEQGEFDLIVSNPPYLTKKDMTALQKEVSFEPKQALFGGEDGLDFYRDIVRLWKDKLAFGGMMIFEIGEGQENEVSALMIQHGFKNVRFKADLCGINRIVQGEKILSGNN